ncbi:RNA polymerase sigma factor [Mycolicibacterium komossense]|uniref:RNA polymerase sigma factor n=1 Tax=Mycolicibacterium komossense TaxID=1779 RepID=UPI0021F28AB7|nr:sigma-70 family RNA polymerase sigma factor [Mycolicibacterium komossense]
MKLDGHDEASASYESASFGAEFIAASDRELINAAAVGERDAFEAIVLRYGPEMLRYARNMLSDNGAAEEVTQDAFVAAWKGLDTFRGDSSLRTWLFTLVSHKVVDHRRRRSVTPTQDWILDTTPAPVTDDPEVRISNTDFLAELNAAMAELPYRQRAAWLLREVDGMTHTEIGRILLITPSAVRGHLVRARATLSERMAAWR